MTPKLSDELRHALAQQPGQPVQVEDPITHARSVLVQLDVFEQLQRPLDYDASEPDPRAYYPAFAQAIHDDLDALGMERYDEDGQSPEQP